MSVQHALAAVPDVSAALQDVGVVGNGQITALVRADGEIPWCCWPRPDGDPVFCTLLMPERKELARGSYSITVLGQSRCSMHYLRNTAVLESKAWDAQGNGVRITTWCPRFVRNGRLYRPAMLVRRIEPESGRPTVRIRLSPAADYADRSLTRYLGSHHVRYIDADQSLRVTTDGSVSYLSEGRAFVLDRPIHLVLGNDEPLADPVDRLANDTLAATVAHWAEWVRGLTIPFEWQSEVIRAAITLRLAVFDDTGAVLAAPTTSIPDGRESAGTWDYRFCWLRDAHSTIQSLNSLGAIDSVESYLRFIRDVVVREGESLLQPVYGISGERDLEEHCVDSLEGMLGVGPVRVGNASCRQRQHDICGSIIVACAHAFLDERLEIPGDRAFFQRLETFGERAASLFDQPGAGPWESRLGPKPHTVSSALCWAACDRLSHIARRLALPDRAGYWARRADSLKSRIFSRTWRQRRGAFSAVLDGDAVDASLLLLPETGLVDAADDRFRQTLAVIEAEQSVAGFLYRSSQDAERNSGQNAYAACSFWWANALAGSGRWEKAREVFEQALGARNSLGLLAERIDPRTGALWGNFPHTAAMAGIVGSAARLSQPWEHAF